MPRRFCPKCGKTEGDFFKGFCVPCYLESHDVLKVPDKVTVKRCHDCGLFFLERKWVPSSNSKIESIIKGKMETELFNPSFKFEWEKEGVDVTVSGSLDSEGFFEVSVTKFVVVKYTDIMCGICKKKGTKSYAVEIQLRGDRKRVMKVVDWILAYTQDLSKYHPEADLFYMKEEHGGVNIFFAFKKVGGKVLNYLHSEKKLDYTASEAKMVRVNPKGKNLTNKSYCFRL